MINQKFIDYVLFFLCKIRQFLGTLINFKVEIYLILVLSNDLNQLLESTCDVVGIWEFLILAGDQFSLVEAEIGVVPHRVVSCIPVLMCTI
jgi:hypothetical protein